MAVLVYVSTPVGARHIPYTLEYDLVPHLNGNRYKQNSCFATNQNIMFKGAMPAAGVAYAPLICVAFTTY
jgi:hypothetical protein